MNFRDFTQELGKALGMELENVGGACGLDIDGVAVMLHDADDLVLVTAEIGHPPPEEGLEALFKTVLKANWLYRGTGGATLAINPDDDSLWLEKYNFLERLDGEKGIEMITRFAETVKTWQELVSGFTPDTPSASALDESYTPSYMDLMQV